MNVAVMAQSLMLIGSARSSQAISLAGVVQGGSVLTGALARSYKLAGVISGGSTLTGAVTVTPAVENSPLFNFLFLDAA